MLAYPIEILPYEIRAKGLNVTFFGVSSSCKCTHSLLIFCRMLMADLSYQCLTSTLTPSASNLRGGDSTLYVSTLQLVFYINLTMANSFTTCSSVLYLSSYTFSGWKQRYDLKQFLLMFNHMLTLAFSFRTLPWKRLPSSLTAKKPRWEAVPQPVLRPRCFLR